MSQQSTRSPHLWGHTPRHSVISAQLVRAEARTHPRIRARSGNPRAGHSRVDGQVAALRSRIHAVFAVAAGAAILVASGEVAGATEDCPRVVGIRAPKAERDAFRKILSTGALAGTDGEPCLGAHVDLVRSGDGWRVTLLVEGRETTREVDSLAAAATWVESWLFPVLERTRQGVTVPAPAPASAKEPAPTAEQAEAPQSRVIVAGPEGQVALLGGMGFGEDGSAWSGPELGARLHFTRTVWLGAALGAGWDTRLSGPARNQGNVDRHGVRASVRGGGRGSIGRRGDAAFGLGVGVVTGRSSRSSGAGMNQSTEQGGFFGELHLDLSMSIATNVSLIGGVAARGHFLSSGNQNDGDAEQPPPPDALPRFVAEGRIGVGWDFGGAR